MRFTFTEDQLLFQESVRTFLDREVTAERIRTLAASETGRSPELWATLSEMGVVGMLVPEEHGGPGMNEVDLVLLVEEIGRSALAEPFVETAAVAVPLLASVGGAAAAEWLPRIAAGEAIVTVGHPSNPVVTDAHVADLLLLERDGELHAVRSADVERTAQPSNDPLRKLFTVDWTPTDATRLASGDAARVLLDAAFDRASLALAAQSLGLAQRMVDDAVAYAQQREQFGKAIGTFQAIKHMLATVQVRIEFGRPVTYKGAFAVANDFPSRASDVSHAKAAATEAARLAAKTALQVHGAVGYTWEVDLHHWMKRAWALEASWGTGAFHRARVADAVLGDGPVFEI